MKVLLVNGSPRAHGNTAALTDLLEGILRARGALVGSFLGATTFSAAQWRTV